MTHTLECVAVVTREGETVPFADLANQAPWRCSVERVIWRDGSSSWGKTWWRSDTGKIDLIGAGAYGDLVVYRSDTNGSD